MILLGPPIFGYAQPSDESSIFLTKVVSPNSFSSGGTGTVLLTIENNSDRNITDITMTDALPDGFIATDRSLFVNSNILTTKIDLLRSGSRYSIGYPIQSPEQASVPAIVYFPQAKAILDGGGAVLTSQIPKVEINQSVNWSNSLAQAVSLLIPAFIIGGLGSTINSFANLVTRKGRTMKQDYVIGDYMLKLDYSDYARIGEKYSVKLDGSKKDGAPDAELIVAVKNQIDSVMQSHVLRITQTEPKSETWELTLASPYMHYFEVGLKDDEKKKSRLGSIFVDRKNLRSDFLLGGVAGVVVLIGLQAIALQFNSSGYIINTQNVITLAVLCLVAGFVPQQIIDKATSDLKQQLRLTQQHAENANVAATSAAIEAQDSQYNAEELAKTATAYMKADQNHRLRVLDTLLKNPNIKGKQAGSFVNTNSVVLDIDSTLREAREVMDKARTKLLIVSEKKNGKIDFHFLKLIDIDPEDYDKKISEVPRILTRAVPLEPTDSLENVIAALKTSPKVEAVLILDRGSSQPGIITIADLAGKL
jgi:uncharacterized repeat protein (TIGR01451 family)